MKLFETPVGLFRKFRLFLFNRMFLSSDTVVYSLNYLRLNILFELFFAALLLSPFAITAGILAAIKQNSILLAIFDLFGYILCIYLVFSKTLTYKARAKIGLAICYTVGIFIILSLGPLSGGPAWLFAFAVLAGILLGTKAALVAIVLNTFALLAVSWLISNGVFGQDFPFFRTAQTLLAAGVNFIVLNTIAAISVSALVKGLASTHEKEKILSNNLEKERSHLIKVTQNLEVEIEERKQAEAKLEHGKKRLDSLIKHSPLGIVDLDRRGRIVSCNKAFEVLFQFKEAEIKGRELDEVIAGEKYVEEAISYTQKTFSGKSLHSSAIRRRKDGSLIDVEFFSFPVTVDREIVGAVGIYQDISARKQAEEALQRSEEKYRELYDNVGDIIFSHDMAGRFITINRAVIEKLGYSVDEIIGRPITDFMLDDYIDFFTQEYLPEIKGTGYSEGVSVYLAKDGSTHYVEYRNTLIQKEGDEPYVSGVGRDITERITAQKEMSRLEKQVQHSQRMESIGTLAGGIAHNFNNLLMGIQGYASLMLLETDTGHPFQERLKNIERLVQSGSKLSGQLLGYAREGKYEVMPIDLNGLVMETSETFGNTRKDIKIYKEIAKDLFGIKADKSQIEQILLNLYVNAADAMPEGGTLYLKTTNTTHEAMAEKPYEVKPGAYVLLMVRDSGRGMDQETMERIFEPFFTTKGLANGTGLGLASVYGILKSHGGYVDVESETGKGSTFYVYLPASEEGTGHPETIHEEKYVRGKETILLVDDEALVLDAGTQILEAMGYSVLQATNGLEAIEVYKRCGDSIDLVILDVVMPEMSGGKTYDHLTRVNPQIKVLLSSGYSLDDEAGEIMKRGCDGFIQKPFRIGELSAKLRGILDEM